MAPIKCKWFEGCICDVPLVSVPELPGDDIFCPRHLWEHQRRIATLQHSHRGLPCDSCGSRAARIDPADGSAECDQAQGTGCAPVSMAPKPERPKRDSQIRIRAAKRWQVRPRS